MVLYGWRVTPLLGIWAGLAGARWYAGDGRVGVDCLLFGFLSVLSNWGALKEIVVQEVDGKLVGSVALVLAAVAYYLGNVRKSDANSLADGISPCTLQFPKARIFPCSTKHARMFPKRHAFEYSYLQCGFPIVPAGVDEDGKGVGSRADVQLGSWWMRVRAEDYLNRGSGAHGFYMKLKSFLREQVRHRQQECMGGDTDCNSTSTTQTGPTHISSQRRAFSAMHSILSLSGTFTTQTIISTR